MARHVKSPSDTFGKLSALHPGSEMPICSDQCPIQNYNHGRDVHVGDLRKYASPTSRKSHCEDDADQQYCLLDTVPLKRQQELKRLNAFLGRGFLTEHQLQQVAAHTNISQMKSRKSVNPPPESCSERAKKRGTHDFIRKPTELAEEVRDGSHYPAVRPPPTNNMTVTSITE
ncbi:hypothetical protein GWK47_011778 [Chionoecetes opilio]|uniref:Uncharacterized protein n=1 Tax=Chionoecetes opilio TaxID=41210 RepID=A0A8J4XXQ6_CHIOP|nr:hypothetical protein GWK47_011778 [Chionoecetes opilio]